MLHFVEYKQANDSSRMQRYEKSLHDIKIN